jgi:hypothetical protein
MLFARLPDTARDIYYRDIIGNISTSAVRLGDNSVEMEVRVYTEWWIPIQGEDSSLLAPPAAPSAPACWKERVRPCRRHRWQSIRCARLALCAQIETRFPMFGGWKTQWYQGYNLPADRFISAAGDEYTLSIDLGVPFENVVTDKITVCS